MCHVAICALRVTLASVARLCVCAVCAKPILRDYNMGRWNVQLVVYVHQHTLTQPQAPIYNYPLAAMSGERRAELVRRVTIIQSLPCISYEVRGDKDKKKEPRE